MMVAQVKREIIDAVQEEVHQQEQKKQALEERIRALKKGAKHV